MEKKLKVGVIGATGMVGQNYLRLLAGHPWFEVTYLAASPRSAGKKYADAVAGRWHMTDDIPSEYAAMVVEDAGIVVKAEGKCDLIFSAVEMDKKSIMSLEEEFSDSSKKVEIPDEDAEKIVSVQDAVDYIKDTGIQDE